MGGGAKHLIRAVEDLDGVEGTTCTLILSDREQREVYSQSSSVEVISDNEGVLTFSYPTPLANSSVNQPPWQVSVSCTDSDGERGENTLSHLIGAIPPPPCTEDCEDTSNEASEEVSMGFSTKETMLVVAAILFVIAIIITPIITITINPKPFWLK